MGHLSCGVGERRSADADDGLAPRTPCRRAPNSTNPPPLRDRGSVRQEACTEHRVAKCMIRKGFRRVTPEQSRAATVRNLRGLRDTAVQFAKNALAENDWRAALACLWRAERYDQQADAMEPGESFR